MTTTATPIRPRHWLGTEDAPPPRYKVGADGGGTRTRVRLWSQEGELLGQGEAGPSALGQGAEQAWLNLGQALRQAAAQAGLAGLGWQQCAVGLGLSGAGVPRLAEAFMAAAPRCGELALDTDGFASVLGAHGGQPGAVIVAGTGSVGEALWPNGERLMVGGWGWQNGDEGSGAWLGRHALQHAQRALDGREHGGALAQAVWDVAGSCRESLLSWGLSAQQQRFATLAPLVFDADERGDAAASRLIDAALHELELLAATLDPKGELPVALQGSVAERLAPRLSSALRARFVAAQGDAVSGALRLLRSAVAA